MAKDPDAEIGDGVVYACEEGCPKVEQIQFKKLEILTFKVRDVNLPSGECDASEIVFSVHFINDQFDHCEFKMGNGNTGNYTVNQWRNLRMVSLQIEKLVNLKKREKI